MPNASTAGGQAPDWAARRPRRQWEFGGFKHRREMTRRVASFTPESVVAEGTGIHWKSPNPALEQVGLRAGGQGPVVKTGAWAQDRSGRCTMAGAFGTQRGVARGLRAAGEEHRLNKVVTDDGIRLGVVLSDIHGKSWRTMIQALGKR